MCVDLHDEKHVADIVNKYKHSHTHPRDVAIGSIPKYTSDSYVHPAVHMPPPMVGLINLYTECLLKGMVYVLYILSI